MAEVAKHVLDLFKLDGRVAYVTGGASGIGAAIAKALAQAGGALAVLDIDLEGAKSIVAEIEADGGRARAFECDVAKPAMVAAAMRRVIETFGRLDIGVNNAGVITSGPAEDVSEAAWRRMTEVDLNGVFFCSQEAGKIMIAQGQGGVIINNASVSGSVVNKGMVMAPYCTAKAAVRHLTKALAAEWAKYGIRVNSISPGNILTPMNADRIKNSPEFLRSMLAATPMARMGLPGEIGGLVVYLASDASSYMTGHDAVIDGGYTVW